MRLKQEIANEVEVFIPNGKAFTENSLLMEVLLDIRDLLQHPPIDKTSGEVPVEPIFQHMMSCSVLYGGECNCNGKWIEKPL